LINLLTTKEMIVERLNGNKLNEGFGEEERFPH
jgi:hypothetical protein